MARTALVEAGIEMACGVQAGALANSRLALSDGSFLDASAALWATGVMGPDFLAASGLACDERVASGSTQRCAASATPFVFAAGDCATIEEGARRPKAGVWAVRAGRHSARQPAASAARADAARWRPQTQALAILGLGDGRALAWRNGVALWGRPIWRWKDWIDRRWMRMYQHPMAHGARPTRCAAAVAAPRSAPMCWPAHWPVCPPARADVLIGLDAPDDAACDAAAARRWRWCRASITSVPSSTIRSCSARSLRAHALSDFMRWARGPGLRWRSPPCPIRRARRCAPTSP